MAFKKKPESNEISIKFSIWYVLSAICIQSWSALNNVQSILAYQRESEYKVDDMKGCARAWNDIKSPMVQNDTIRFHSYTSPGSCCCCYGGFKLISCSHAWIGVFGQTLSTAENHFATKTGKASHLKKTTICRRCVNGFLPYNAYLLKQDF